MNPLSPSKLAHSLRMLADLIAHDGTPGRTFADQALTTDYQVHAPEFVTDFAEKHDLTVTAPDGDGGTIWAELPLGPGTLYGQEQHVPVYRGAVVLRVVYVPPRPEVDRGAAAKAAL